MYRLKYRKDHHRADITGLVAEHILVAEEELDRPLEKGELVHHKDFDKLNNIPTNLLFPISRPEHQKLPEYQARFILAKGLYNEFVQWWLREKAIDVSENILKIKELERKLVRAENDRERIKKNRFS